MITIIGARDNYGAIGKNGTIPWHIPEDLQLFQKETLGGAIIMGRKTWESLPKKPLAGRLNIVVSSGPQSDEGYIAAKCVSSAIAQARIAGYTRIYAIGGQSIYEDAVRLADRILVTDVDTTVDGADTFFPAIDPTLWVERMNRPVTAADAPIQARAIEYMRRRFYLNSSPHHRS